MQELIAALEIIAKLLRRRIREREDLLLVKALEDIILKVKEKWGANGLDGAVGSDSSRQGRSLNSEK